jgi:hypothetical protein
MRKDRFTEEFRADAAAESDVDLVWVVRNNLIKSALQRLQRHIYLTYLRLFFYQLRRAARNALGLMRRGFPWIRQNSLCARPLVPNSLTSRWTSCLANHAAAGAV